MNPYWGATFFKFFALLFSRIFSGASFLASDEMQLGVLALVAVSCGMIGPFLVLKRMAMFANSLSHTILFGVLGAFLFARCFWGGAMFDPSTLLIGALLASLLTAWLTEIATRIFRLPADASVGLVFSTLFALSIFIATIWTRNVHLSTEAVMGNSDLLLPADFYFAMISTLCNGLAIGIFYRQLQITSFDGAYATTLGIRSKGFHMLLLLLTSITCIAAFRAVGVLLVLAFLTGPYLTARLFSNRLKALLILSPCIGIFASLIGVALSRHILSVYDLPLSTGGIVVCVIGGLYAVGVFFQFLYKCKACEKRSLS